MQRRFRPRGNFSRRFAQPPKAENDLLWAISAGRDRSGLAVTQTQTEYVAKNKFEDFAISADIKRNIAKKQYTVPTPIQDQAIGEILAGRDVIGIANTGTGKTAAFLVPLIDKVVKNRNEKVLIIAPTRELAQQISDELRDFAFGLNIWSVLLIGGANMNRQINQLWKNPSFVIGTPGRIRDLIERRYLDLSKFNNVVLDEADRMVDIGFISEIKYFISLLPTFRQSLFFSATISGKVKEILASFVKDPVTVSVKVQDTAVNIKQDVIKVTDRSKKVDQLHDLLIQDGFDKVLVFGRTKRGIQKLADELEQRGFKAGAIHGNKRQGQRMRILEQFKKNEIKVLLATDVASRGLDIEDVSHVINYDLPTSYDDYIHRIGRTGRANKTGVALTFV